MNGLSSADVAHFYLRQTDGFTAADFGIMIIAPGPNTAQQIDNVLVAAAAPDQRPYIVSFRREQAQEQLTLRRQSGAGTVPTEWLRNTGNEADFTRVVGIAPAIGHLAAIAGIQRFKRKLGIDAIKDFRTGQHFLEIPPIGTANVHKFNEPQNMTGMAKMARHGYDLPVVQTFAHHHIDLDRRQADTGCFFYAVQHLPDTDLAIAHAFKHRVIQGIQADRYPSLPRIFQRLRLLCKQRAVSR